MAKIKFGIDLGTTNSAISKIEKGKVKIIKSDVQKDTMPSCVSFNKKQMISAGDRAYNQLKLDKLRGLKAQNNNCFVISLDSIQGDADILTKDSDIAA